MTDRVAIYEVGPRDGLQNEARVIPVAEKVALIDALTGTGLAAVEAGAFVSPKWVPQMADTAEVLAAMNWNHDTPVAVLVPNLRGWEACAATGAPVAEIAVFISASEGFSRANLNCSVAESLDRIAPVVAAVTAAGRRVRGYVSCVTDCPFDGKVPPGQVAEAVAALRRLAPMPVSLGDTIGAGTPATVTAMLGAVLEVAPAADLAGHFHDTGGRALANVEAAMDLGLRVFDAAVGGLGGCPYAPGAPGNLATEAVLDRLAALGVETGVDRDAIGRAAEMARAMRSGKGGKGRAT